MHLSLPQIVHAQQQVKLTADQLAKDLLEDSKVSDSPHSFASPVLWLCIRVLCELLLSFLMMI